MDKFNDKDKTYVSYLSKMLSIFVYNHPHFIPYILKHLNSNIYNKLDLKVLTFICSLNLQVI